MEKKITSNKALERVIQFWIDEIRKRKNDITDTQFEIFTNELRHNLGDPCIYDTHFQLSGGAAGYKNVDFYFEGAIAIENAMKAANIECDFDTEIYVCIVIWDKKPEMRTVKVYYNNDPPVSIGDFLEDFEDE